MITNNAELTYMMAPLFSFNIGGSTILLIFVMTSILTFTSSIYVSSFTSCRHFRIISHYYVVHKDSHVKSLNHLLQLLDPIWDIVMRGQRQGLTTQQSTDECQIKSLMQVRWWNDYVILDKWLRINFSTVSKNLWKLTKVRLSTILQDLK